MSFGLRPCILHGWASCDGNCGNCGTTATTFTDGYWYHGNGKLGGEFYPNKPDDEEHYGEYVKVVRCKDCKHQERIAGYSDYQPNTVFCNKWEHLTDIQGHCYKGERKDEVEE